MIPVTTFAGKKVALFGLGASGLASARALLAGGADVVAFDDTEGSLESARAAGIPIEDLRHIDWSRISALVLAPGVPLTHPAPHWTVGLARTAAVAAGGGNGRRGVAARIGRAGKRIERISVRRPLSDGLYIEGDRVMRAAGGTARAVVHIGGIGALRGAHNAQNAAAATAAGLVLGLAPETIQKGLTSFPGLAHRMEQIGRQGNVLFVNDSKATNADAAARALASFMDIFWIAGGKAKSGGITALSGYFPRIRKAYLIGEAAGPFAGTLQGKVPFVVAGTLDRAVELAAQDAQAAGLAEPVV